MMERQSHTLDRQGWYYSQGGAIKGPSSSRHLLGLLNDVPSGQPILVSRVGLDRWYPLGDLLELQGIHQPVDADILHELETLQKVVNEHTAALERHLTNQGDRPGSLGRGAKSVPTGPVPGIKLGASGHYLESMLAQQTMGPSSKKSEAREATVATAAPAVSKSAAQGNAARASQASALVRSRLRIGKTRQPLLISFVLLPLTFGIYWGVWARSVALEVLWHTLKRHDRQAGSLPPLFTSFIPGFHVYFIYRLAALMKRGPRETDRYQISPWLAVVLSIVPPLAMLYLQARLNQRWQMQVQNSGE